MSWPTRGMPPCLAACALLLAPLSDLPAEEKSDARGAGIVAGDSLRLEIRNRSEGLVGQVEEVSEWGLYLDTGDRLYNIGWSQIYAVLRHHQGTWVRIYPLKHPRERNKLESWYTYWALGRAGARFSGELDETVGAVRRHPGVGHYPFSLDLFGFYWPLRGERTLLGGVVNTCYEDYMYGGLQQGWVTVDLISLSAIHFLRGRIGQGPFVRGDVGVASVDVRRLDWAEDWVTFADHGDWGIGFLVGGGFGVPVRSGTRVLLTATYSHRRVKGDAIRCWGLTVGGLF